MTNMWSIIPCPLGRYGPLNWGTPGSPLSDSTLDGAVSMVFLRKQVLNWEGWASSLSPFANSSFRKKLGCSHFSKLMEWLFHLSSYLVGKLIGFLLSDLRCLTSQGFLMCRSNNREISYPHDSAQVRVYLSICLSLSLLPALPHFPARTEEEIDIIYIRCPPILTCPRR